MHTHFHDFTIPLGTVSRENADFSVIGAVLQPVAPCVSRRIVKAFTSMMKPSRLHHA
jgi:hypothetical protein